MHGSINEEEMQDVHVSDILVPLGSMPGWLFIARLQPVTMTLTASWFYLILCCYGIALA